MDRIVLIGGPCSGQIHDVAPSLPEVAALDRGGKRHIYSRAEIVDLAHDLRVVLFRHAQPEPAT